MGVRLGGRAKGTPNKATADVRKSIALLAERNVGKLERWITEVADGVEKPVIRFGEILTDKSGNPLMVKVGQDPGRAADLLLRALEYHIPKLARSEVTGQDGGPLIVEFPPLPGP